MGEIKTYDFIANKILGKLRILIYKNKEKYCECFHKENFLEKRFKLKVLKKFYSKEDILKHLKENFKNYEFRFIINDEMNGYYLLWNYVGDGFFDLEIEKIIIKHIEDYYNKINKNGFRIILPTTKVYNLDKFIAENKNYKFLKDFKRKGKYNYQVFIEEVFEKIMSLNNNIYIKGSYALISAYNVDISFPRDINFNVTDKKIIRLCLDTLKKWFDLLEIENTVKIYNYLNRNRGEIQVDGFQLTFETADEALIKNVIDKNNAIRTFCYDFLKSKNKSKYFKKF